jgi:hypothetical protein
MLAWLVVGAIFVGFGAIPCRAAKISVEGPFGPEQIAVVTIDGGLEANDTDVFNAKTNALSKATIVLRSDGGNLYAGIKIGEIIRLRGFSTFVPSQCASACALVWLGGTQRYMAATARLGFHAASDSRSGLESGVGNAVVGAYLTKIGLPYSAIIYITTASPQSMTWTTAEEAKRHGIEAEAVSAPPGVQTTGIMLSREETVLSVPTRYGEVSIVKSAEDCCKGAINFRSQKIDVGFAAKLAGPEGVYQVKEGDLLVLRLTTDVRGMPDSLYVLLVDEQKIADLGNNMDLWNPLGTFKIIQQGNEVLFDLGFDRLRKKSAIYRDGVLSVVLATRPITTLPVEHCDAVLKDLESCLERRVDCGDDLPLGMAGFRYFTELEENMPTFKMGTFLQLCSSVCMTKRLDRTQSRKLLCGY